MAASNKVSNLGTKENERVVVITGGNAGIGLALATRLISEHSAASDGRRLHVCLACRHAGRAEAARRALEVSITSPGVRVSTTQLDLALLSTVDSAVEALSHKFEHIDQLYCNAGYMGKTKLDFGAFFSSLTSLPKIAEAFSTGHGLLIQQDQTTADGLPAVFQTNVFAHYLLIKKLIDRGLLGGSTNSQVIWTGSSNAHPDCFSLDDIQHKRGTQPYSSSKYLTELLSIHLNSKYNQQNVFSHVMSPGLVVTNMTQGIMPSWFWSLFWPLFCALRLLVPSVTYTPYNGAEALVWLCRQNPSSLDSRVRFRSCTNVLGTCYIDREKIGGVDDSIIEEVVLQMDLLEESLRRNT